MILLQSLVTSAAPWVLGAVTVILGLFAIYVGVAVAVALFHPKAAARRHALDTLRVLLRVFGGRS